VLRVGTAVGATLADFTEFDRKSYFYPDIPKGYQISQYEHPLVVGGTLAGVPITRVHLEEDTARSIHAGGKSLIDFNRAGVPLMELVTEPAIHDAETAGNFARELQLLLRTLGASDANLEKGEMRIEANISVAEEGSEKLGTKVEVKNLNSFRSVERAIAYEIRRQSELLEKGEKVSQETRGWDETKQSTFRQRTKEGSADYRYFPEPDLPKLVISDVQEFSHEALLASLPELPWKRRERYTSLGLSKDTVAHIGSDVERATFFDSVLSELENDATIITLAANYLVSDVAGWLAKDSARTFTLLPGSFSKLMRMVHENKVSSRGAKEVLTIMLEKGGDPEVVAKEGGFLQVSDDAALRAAVVAVITREAVVVADYRKGKEAALEYLVGQGMKETKGAGNPALIREILIEEIGKA
jgi:aspartyl-tRNA(Asn)/glutamyl-tRNA(Gln) amidotransferase subunit B